MQTTTNANNSTQQRLIPLPAENLQLANQYSQQEEIKDTNASESKGQLTATSYQNNTLQTINNPTKQVTIEEKTICYLSSFDLNINDWFNDYENLIVFKMNMQQSLGDQWHTWIQSTLSSSQVQEDDNQQIQNVDYPLFVLMINFYLIKFYGHEGVCKEENLTKHVFDRIYSDVCQFFVQHKYTVHDNEGLRPLLDTFFRVAAIEYKKILSKIELDQDYQCHLTEKALAEYNDQIRKAAALEQRERDLAEQQKKLASTQLTTSGEDSSRRVGGYAHLSQYVPSLPLIRNNVIKPLLFAIEKVVEQYIPLEQQQQTNQDQQAIEGKIDLTDQRIKIQDNNRSERALTEGNQDEETASQTQTLKSADDHLNLIKRKLKRMQLSPKSSKQQNKSLKKRTFKNLDRAWVIDDCTENLDCIIAERMSPISDNEFRLEPRQKFNTATNTAKSNRRSLKLQNKIIGKASLQISMHQSGHADMMNNAVLSKTDTVTGTFSTNIFELNHHQLDCLNEQDRTIVQEAETDFRSVDVIRFIKPNKIFYNQMMAQWTKFSLINKQELECRKVMESHAAKEALTNKFIAFASTQMQMLNRVTNNQQIKVIGQFAAIVIEEHFSLVQQNTSECGSPTEMSMCSFFVNVKTSLMWRWECDVVKKSTAFQKQATALQTI